MPRCDWVRVIREVVSQLERQRGDQSVRYGLDELFLMSGGSQEPRAYRDRGYWAAVARGDAFWSTARDAGLVVNFEPDERGVRVTLWGKARGKAVAFFSSEHEDVKARPVLTLTLSVDNHLLGALSRFVVSSVGWEEFLADCGLKASEANESRSAKVFGERYKERVVEWSGVVAWVKDGIVDDGFSIGITMSPSESLIGSSDLVLKAPAKMREAVLVLNKGDKVVFVGRIASQGGRILDHSLDIVDLRARTTNDD